LPNGVVSFTDQSTINPGNITGWYWSFGDGDTSTTQNPAHVYTSPGSYNVCLVVTSNQSSCPDSICFTYVVEPTEVIVPNIITPNGDGKNDSLVFKNLEFYPNSDLKIYNRWGSMIYSSANYKNDWQGGNVSDGTYYFVLNVPGLENGVKKGYVEILSHK
jgi:gliding motility-associated-like protein